MDITRKLNLENPEEVVVEYRSMMAYAPQKWMQTWLHFMKLSFDQQRQDYPQSDEKIQLLVNLFIESTRVSEHID